MEEINLPEIKTEKLLSILDSIRWENGYRFEFNGIEFLILTISREDLKTGGNFGDPAEFFQSTENGGYDIYLHDTIPKSKRKKVLFHEILEASIMHQNMTETDAHAIALAEEEKVFGARKK